MNKDHYAVIMAGGVGKRLWPLSRRKKPKQFLRLLGNKKSLIQNTFQRLSKIIPKENIYVSSNIENINHIREQLPEIYREQIILEPHRRNTAPAMALASYKVAQKNPNAVMLIAPADHNINNEEEAIKTFIKALDAATQNDQIITIGIKPTYPSTLYGYIEHKEGNDEIKDVIRYKEKPDLDTAKQFISSGNFSWNSGIFFWNAPTIKNAFQKHLPKTHAMLEEMESESDKSSFLVNNFHRCEKTTIDYGVMEKADNIKVIPGNFHWEDIGGWKSLFRMHKRRFLK